MLKAQPGEQKTAVTPVRTKVKRLEAASRSSKSKPDPLKSSDSPEEAKSAKRKRRSGGQGRQPPPYKLPSRRKY